MGVYYVTTLARPKNSDKSPTKLNDRIEAEAENDALVYRTD
jgi:hypothetical protein